MLENMHALKHCVHAYADLGDGGDDNHTGNERILLGRGAALAAHETLHNRSRSIGISGMSAGVSFNCAISFGLSHLIASCSSVCGVPSQRRQM